MSIPEGGLSELFRTRDFPTTRYRFRFRHREDLLLAVDASNAASTDFDKTGEIVWLVSVLTAHYLASEMANELKGEAILELGAGAGLCGLAAAAVGSSLVVFTDEEEEVLSLLERNMRHVLPSCTAHVMALSWGNASDAALLASLTRRHRWRFIVGADVVYWSAAIAPLVETVRALLAADGVFVLGCEWSKCRSCGPTTAYFECLGDCTASYCPLLHADTNRVDSNLRALMAAAVAAGFDVEETDRSFSWRPDDDDAGNRNSLTADRLPHYAGNTSLMTIFRWTWRAGCGPAVDVEAT